jgi:hypothetical protein
MRDDERVQGQQVLDSRIDAAVQSYAEPPEQTAPRVALARMMEQVRSEPPARRIGWWIWGIAAAAACMAAVMVALWGTQAPQAPQIAKAPQPPGVVTVPDRAARPSVAEVRVPAARHATHAEQSAPRREEASTTPLPKLDVFPTPAPLSPQEEALVAFARRGPPEAQHAVLEDQKHWDDPIIVAGLQEKPGGPGSQQDR